MKKLFKKIIASVLTSALVLSSFASYDVFAVFTTTSDATVKGSSSISGAKGSWVTGLENPTIYRIYPIRLEKPLESVNKNSKLVLNYKDYYKDYRDLALYVTSDKEAMNSYYFTSASTRGEDTIAGMTLNSDGSLSFKKLGVDLNLPKHKFNAGESKYVSFSDELNKKIITEGENSNIIDIFNNYIKEVNNRKNNLSDKGKIKLNSIITQTTWGTDDFDDNCRNFALVIELCSTATNRYDNKKYVLSYGDMTKLTAIGNDPYYIYKVFADAAKDDKLLSWKAVYKERNITIQPESRLGEAVFFTCLAPEKGVKRSQAINIVLNLDKELNANIKNEDVSMTYGMTNSCKNPKVSLASEGYTSVKDNVYDNKLEDTEITLGTGKNYVITKNKSNSLKTLSGKSAAEYDKDSILLGYQILALPVSINRYDLSAFRNIDLSKALKNVKASTKVIAVPEGFGNKYSLSFKVNDKTVRTSVADALKTINGVSNISCGVSYDKVGTITNLADLQSATFLSGKLVGKVDKDNNYNNVKGKVYTSIAYLAKDKKVTSKEAEVFIDEDGNIKTLSSIQSKKYSVASTAKWNVTGKEKASAYVIAWKASDYDLVDEKTLAKKLLNGKVLRGIEGISILNQSFQEATGVKPLGVKYVSGDKSIEVGSSALPDKSLTGINVLIINVSQEMPLKTEAKDIVESDELNYIYPNLLGWRSSVGKISPIGNGIPNAVYPYTVEDNNYGALNEFNATRMHYYYKPTGLFGTYTQSTKSFSGVSYPSYAYNLSRGLWGDALVASNYRGVSATDKNIQDDIKNNLGFKIGAVGNKSSVTCGENVDGTVSTKKSDTYNFLATILRRWYTYHTDVNGNSYSVKHQETVNQKNKYTLSHTLNKYTCLALGTALNGNTNKVGYNTQSNKGIGNKVTMITQSNNTLTVYPEVAYKYYFASTSGGVLNNVKPYTVYVMGERARTMKPSSIRGIDMDYTSANKNVANGSIVSDGTLTGSTANKMSGGNQVIAQGSNITMKAGHNVDYRLISYSLDVVDKVGGVSVRNEFSKDNVKYNPAKEHEDYVQNFLDSVEVDVYMHIGNKEFKTKSSYKKPKVSKGTESSYITIKFADGVIDENSKTSVINDMAKEYGISTEEARKMFDSSGFEKQLQDMFESNNDSNNKSKGKWYDEESITLCIKKYVTTLNLNTILVQDKIDWNVLGSAGRKGNGQTKHISADAYFSMSVSLPNKFNDCTLTNANVLFKKQKIGGTEFKVSSSSTNDFIDGDD